MVMSALFHRIRFQPLRLLTPVLAVALFLVIRGVCHAASGGEIAAQFERWGAETLADIKQDFWIERRGLYANEVDPDEPTRPAYMWGAGVQLTALAAAARVDPQQYSRQLTDYADALEQYWFAQSDVGGYNVLPRMRSAERYYDDNAWIVLAQIEIFSVTGDRKYLDRAATTMRFVMSGEDDKLGGGIYWREKDCDTKNTCSNAPAIVGALRLYQLTEDPEYLAAAERLYDWTKSKLQDDDGLYFDNIRLDGRVDRRKFTYNTALMIRGNCLLHEVTGDDEYLALAERMAQSAAERWIDAETGAIRDTGKFAHMLLEALLAVDVRKGQPSWRDVVRNSLEYVHEHTLDENGRYSSRWYRSRRRRRWRRDSFQLIDQASAARAYFVAVDAFRQRDE